MKKTIFTLVGTIVLTINLNAQNTGELSKAHKLPNNTLNWTHENCAKQHAPMIPEGQIVYDTTTAKISAECLEDCGWEKQGIDVQVGRNFETNHLFGGYPADNNLAISNSGKIVSVDNSTIAYFNENGDSIVQFGLPWNDFYGVSSALSVFDPKVLYDSYDDRFILLTLLKDGGYTDSRILLSFSQNNIGVDSISWNHYQIHCDSVYKLPSQADFWFDYGSIAVNKNELFVSLNVFDFIGSTSLFEEAIIFQINKSEGINGLPNLIIKEWKDIEISAGNNAFSVVPLMEASQLNSYEDTMYFVSNNSSNSSTYYWFDLFGDINQASASINPHTTSTTQFYSVPSFASQFGGNGTDRIKFIDARIQNGYFQNGKLHFVHHRSDNGWSEVLYGRIVVSSNTFDHNTWGGDGTNMNYMYPSIAHFGSTPTEENAMITFTRTGPGIYNEICVVNYENGWSPQTTIVKSSVDLLNLATDIVSPWDTLERIGDYSDIQRKYNDITCWLVGAFPFGSSPNHFGSTSGVNTWVAEVGRDGVGISENEYEYTLQLHPNPSNNGMFYLNGVDLINRIFDIKIIDPMGRLVPYSSLSISPDQMQFQLDEMNGIFFVTALLKNGNYDTFKVHISYN